MTRREVIKYKGASRSSFLTSVHLARCSVRQAVCVWFYSFDFGDDRWSTVCSIQKILAKTEKLEKTRIQSTPEDLSSRIWEHFVCVWTCSSHKQFKVFSSEIWWCNSLLMISLLDFFRFSIFEVWKGFYEMTPLSSILVLFRLFSSLYDWRRFHQFSRLFSILLQIERRYNCDYFRTSMTEERFLQFSRFFTHLFGVDIRFLVQV